MIEVTTWRSDDQCPVCGNGLTVTDDQDGNQVGQDCRACGWSAIWEALADLAEATPTSRSRTERPQAHRPSDKVHRYLRRAVTAILLAPTGAGGDAR
jgi:hypothetical protein